MTPCDRFLRDMKITVEPIPETGRKTRRELIDQNKELLSRLDTAKFHRNVACVVADFVLLWGTCR